MLRSAQPPGVPKSGSSAREPEACGAPERDLEAREHPSLYDTVDVGNAEAAMDPPSLSPGDVIDRFRIGVRLGEGGHGVVYSAEHVELGYPVAFKVLERSAGLDPRRRARFRREAILGARVRHRNLVAILDAGELADGAPYLVMEHVEGVELARLLAQGPLSPAAVIDLGQQLLCACAALSAHGIVHRDVKPQNVMIARAVDGAMEVKLLDFGIVKALRAGADATLTIEGFVLGTPHYMSPEQVRGLPLDPRSDLFAVAVLLYEAIAGSPPIDDERTEGVLTKMLIEDPIPLEERCASCPRELAAVVTRGLAKERNARFRTAASMAEALREVGEALRLPRGAAAWRGTEAAYERARPPLERSAPPPRGHERRPWRVSERSFPTPPERPSALRSRRPAPRVRPPWWPAAALLLAALLGGWAIDAVSSAEEPATTPSSAASP